MFVFGQFGMLVYLINFNVKICILYVCILYKSIIVDFLKFFFVFKQMFLFVVGLDLCYDGKNYLK